MKIHAVQTGSVKIKTRQRKGVGHGPMRMINTLLDREWTEALPIFAWVIEHDDGLLIVDTGETSRTAEPGYFPRWHPFFRFGTQMFVAQEDEIGPSMRRLGLSPDDVRWVVMTHLHTDHAGGLSHFLKAEIIVTRQEYKASQGVAGKLNGYLSHHFPAWFAPRLLDFESKPFADFPQSVRLTEGVHLVATFGHSVGHLSVIVQDGDLSYFFAGDTSYTEGHLLERAIDGVAPDEHAAVQTTNRILAYANANPTVYLPSHDRDSLTRLEARKIISQS